MRSRRLSLSIWLLFLLVVVLLSSCTSATATNTAAVSPSVTEPAPTSTDELPKDEPTEISTVTPLTPTENREDVTPQAEPERKTHYTLAAELDYDRHTLRVEAQIHYFNNSSDLLAEMLLRRYAI